MLASIGRARFRSTYICTACLIQVLPRPDVQSRRRLPNREFSTTPGHPQSNNNNASNATEAAKKSLKRRRRGRSTARFPNPKNALATLKASLPAEETASKRLKSKPKSKKEGFQTTDTTRATPFGNTLLAPEVKAIAAKKAASAKSLKANKAAKSTKTETSNTTKGRIKIGAEEAKELVEGRQTKVKPESSFSSVPQRRKADAVLLGVKSKRAADSRKKINSHVHTIGENETRKALVKIIENGKLFKGRTAKALPQIRKNIPQKSLSIQRVLSKMQSGRLVPPVRIVTSKPCAEFLNLKRLENKSLKEAMQDRSSRRSSTPTRTAARPIRNKPGENVRTGPLEGFEIKTLDASDLELTPISKPQPRIPSLCYGLDRVLFNPGVYQLQDPRSRVFNFDPYLQTIMPVSEFDFTALKKYITSSRDKTLLATAREQKKKYTGSTSSTTAALAHFHFLLSQWRPVNAGMLSQGFPVEFHTFTALQRAPSAIFLRWKDGVYAIDADKQFDTANILSTLGKSMEKLLTLPTEDFEKYRKQNSDQIPMEEREAEEAFHYTTMGDFLLRSQLDAHDPRLPGTGMFDLKTRAVVSIRMDTAEYEQGMNYEIRQRYGKWESYEREYYDMIRAAFLKYSLQVRMGRMDGIFVAYHNTQRIFGFQYISLPELDLALHGTEDTTTGDSEFKMSLELLNKVLDRAAAKHPGKSLRLHFETRGTDVPFMYIFAEPMEDEQIMEIQESNKAVIEEFEKRVLGLSNEEVEEELSEEDKKAAEWANMRARVEKNMEKDELDIEDARAIAESMIKESDIFGSEAISAEEKERLINELLESSAFSEDEDEDEESMVSKGDGDSVEDGIEGANADSDGNDIDDNATGEEGEENDEEDEGEQEEDDEDESVEKYEIVEDAENTDSLDMSSTDNVNEEPVLERSEKLTNLESIVSVEDVQDETNEVVNAIMGTDSVDTDNGELIANQELSPDDATLDTSTQEFIFSGKPSTTADAEMEFQTPKVAVNDTQAAVAGEDSLEILAMTLTIRNKVNGKYVDRPKGLTKKDKWTVEYSLEDMAKHRVARLYQACQTRRSRALSAAKKNENSPWNNRYLENLRELSKKGKEWREKQDSIDRAESVKVVDQAMD